MAEILHFGDIPLGEVAIELGVGKHAPHVEHGSGGPFGYIARKSASLKHAAHRLHLARIPLGDVAVESGILEHGRHVRGVGDIPLRDVSIELVEGRRLKQAAKIRDAGDIDVVQVAMKSMRLDFVVHEG